jgi:hypothetical protein
MLSNYATLEEAYNIPIKKKTGKLMQKVDYTKNIPGLIENEQQYNLLNENGVSEGFDYNNNVYASQCYYPNTFSSLSSPECEKFEGYKAPNQCAPLQAPIYKHEISKDTKQAYEDAINIALDDTNQPVQSNLDDTILPYDEDDMDLYFDTPMEVVQPPILKKTKKQSVPVNYNWLRDIFTIIFIGLIIIFMCDVIARIAISIGMQKQFLHNQFS